MNRSTGFVVLTLLVLCAVTAASGAIVIKRFDAVDYDKCGGLVRVAQGGHTNTVTIIGDWVENLTSANAGSGVTVTLSNGRNGATNANGPLHEMVGSINAVFTATSSAATGNRTVTFRDGVGSTVTMTIFVLAPARITSTTAPAPQGAFTDVNVTIAGTSLGAITSVRAEAVSDLVTKVIGASGEPVTGVTAATQVVSSSSTGAVIHLTFSQAVRKVTTNLTIAGVDPCSGYSALPRMQATTSLSIEAAAAAVNHLCQINFLPSRTFTSGGVATFELSLCDPASQAIGVSRGGNLGITVTPAGQKISYRMDPPDLFEQADVTQPYNEGAAFNTISVAPGDISVRLTLKVKQCHSTGGTTLRSCKILTWTNNTNTMAPPDFKDALFNVNCP